MDDLVFIGPTGRHYYTNSRTWKICKTQKKCHKSQDQLPYRDSCLPFCYFPFFKPYFSIQLLYNLLWFSNLQNKLKSVSAFDLLAYFYQFKTSSKPVQNFDFWSFFWLTTRPVVSKTWFYLFISITSSKMYSKWPRFLMANLYFAQRL